MASTLELLNAAQMAFMLNPPALMVVQTSAQTFGTSGTAATVQFQQINQDTYSGYSTSTWLYTVPVAGTYDVEFGVFWSGNATGNRYARLLQNGNTSSTLIDNDSTVGTSPAACLVAGKVVCAVGDTIGVQTVQYSGGSLTTQAGGGYNSFLNLTFRHF